MHNLVFNFYVVQNASQWLRMNLLPCPPFLSCSYIRFINPIHSSHPARTTQAKNEVKMDGDIEIFIVVFRGRSHSRDEC